MNKIGNWWNDKSIEIYNIDGRNIALYGWNGEKYTDCFEVNKNIMGTFFHIIKTNIIVIPIYDSDFEIINYEIVEG